ncbi:hypothetical protein CBS101457_001873 [Exobasidium rhododendri]|nr:hypothetical protein CBS101457_001873 [Exobasidium rhododendri]
MPSETRRRALDSEHGEGGHARRPIEERRPAAAPPPPDDEELARLTTVFVRGMSGNERLVDTRQIAHAAIANFLEQQGYQSTLESFQQDAGKAGWTWQSGDDESQRKSETDQYVSLEGLIKLHQSNLALQKRQRLLAKKLLSKSPTDLTLPGPPSLDFKLTKTHENLHNSNILSLSLCTLPTYTFSTTEARYVTQTRRLLCSTAADKRIVFSDVDSGEMIEVFEPGTGSSLDDRHSAAVLWTAQNPNKSYQREFVSCGMDSKVIVWDLLHRKPIQILRNHTKFVVKCAFSPCGQYLATCSYDKTICVYKRSGVEPVVAEDDEEFDEMPPPLTTTYDLIHTATTVNNPESILFVRARPGPSKNDDGLGKEDLILGPTPTEHGDDDLEDDEVLSKRNWLAYTVRSDSFVHYIALPMDVDTESADEVASLSTDLSRSKIGDSTTPIPEDWTVLHYNTNTNRLDYHVSYSLMHLTLHPTQNHICIQTGDHSIPSTGYAASSSALSRILIMPLLSSLRSTTLWTGVESSGFATIRHEWLPDGSAAWVTSEEGYARLIDTKGKIRAKVLAHGGPFNVGGSESQRAATWSRGGNSLIKSLVVLDDRGTLATCGYDRTIRIVSRD